EEKSSKSGSPAQLVAPPDVLDPCAHLEDLSVVGHLEKDKNFRQGLFLVILKNDVYIFNQFRAQETVYYERMKNAFELPRQDMDPFLEITEETLGNPSL